MELDWSTFILEIINFLVLLWILKRFLYTPVLTIIEKRRQNVEQTLQNARQLHDEAEQLEKKYANRLADWEQEKQKARATLDQEIEAERARRIQDLAAALGAERQKAQTRENREHTAYQRQAELKALQQGGRFASQLLTAAVGPEVEKRLVELALDNLKKLTPEQLHNIQDSIEAGVDKCRISSAYPLEGSLRQSLERVLRAVLENIKEFEYIEEPQLIAGLQIVVGSWALELNIREELQGFIEFAHDSQSR